MKKVILLSFALLICGAAMSQSKVNVKRDAQGNYVSVSKPKKAVSDSVLTASYIDKDKVKHKIYVGSRGGKYILRTSKKSGKQYKYYLKEK